MSNCGTVEKHCCWLGYGGKCQYVEPSDEIGFIWRCALRYELGSWDAVHLDSRYLSNVKPWLESYSIVDCGNWPPPGVTCRTCGEVG